MTTPGGQWAGHQDPDSLRPRTCPVCAPGLPHRTAAHCGWCHAAWNRASSAGHCPVCHCTFSTPGVFDRHLTPGGCRPPEQVVYRSGPRAGQRVFADPVPNGWGTPVYRMAGEDGRWAPTPEPGP